MDEKLVIPFRWSCVIERINRFEIDEGQKGALGRHEKKQTIVISIKMEKPEKCQHDKY